MADQRRHGRRTGVGLRPSESIGLAQQPLQEPVGRGNLDLFEQWHADRPLLLGALAG